MSSSLNQNSGNLLFPVFLKLDQLDILIVGGGNVGQEKLEALLKNNPAATVRLIATHIKTEVWALATEHPSVELIERPFDLTDLDGVEVLILATDSPSLHVEIKELAKEKGILTNVADTPQLCDFYLGATVKKGNLKIGISTNGQSPTFAKRFRELLEESLSEDIDELLNSLHRLRNRLQGDFQYKVKKLNEYTASLVGAGSEIEKRGTE